MNEMHGLSSLKKGWSEMQSKERSRSPVRTDKELLLLLSEYSVKAGRTLTVRDCRAVGIPVKQLCRAYGSYNGAVIEAGLKPNKLPTHNTTQNEAILYQYIDSSYDKGAPLNVKDLNQASGMYSASVYANIFGGMNGVRMSAGFDPLPVDRTRYRKEDVQHNLKGEVVKLGRPLTAREINSNPNLPSVTTVVKSFGTNSLLDVWQLLGIE